MTMRKMVVGCSITALAVGCIPAGGSNFGGASGGPPVQSNQIVGAEIQDVFSEGSVFIDWDDGYAECGFFSRDGWYEFDGYYRERGVYYYEWSSEEQWWPSGSQLCIGDSCYYAEWTGGDLVHLRDSASGYTGYAEIYEGPGFYYDNCGLV